MLESLAQIRDSGLLELYVIGELDSKQRQEIEYALNLYPQLKTDLIQIERALYIYALANAIAKPRNFIIS